MTKVGFYQFSPAFGEVERNLAQVLSVLAGAEADLLVLPELPFTGYGFADRAELERLAEEPSRSAAVGRLAALCRARGYHLVTGFAEKRGERCFNSALLIGPRGLVEVYRKLHLFDAEKDLFDPGDLPLRVRDAGGMKIGMMVCFDWIFPETARVLALQGAEVICHPSNLVLTLGQQAMLTRCVENGVFAVTANRYGCERRQHREFAFTGQSQIAAPMGELVYRSPADADDLAVATIDPARARDKKVTPRNDVLADRRPGFYRRM